jgi:hypothetical protein
VDGFEAPGVVSKGCVVQYEVGRFGIRAFMEAAPQQMQAYSFQTVEVLYDIIGPLQDIDRLPKLTQNRAVWGRPVRICRRIV